MDGRGLDWIGLGGWMGDAYTRTVLDIDLMTVTN